MPEPANPEPANPEPANEVTITRIGGPAHGEYVARVAGAAAVGRLTWQAAPGHPDGGVRIADHTLVPTEIGGKGVAARLVAALIADARAQGFRVVPACSYVAAAFARHPEWSDLKA